MEEDSEDDRDDRLTVLDLVCAKMTKWVIQTRQEWREDVDCWSRQEEVNVYNIVDSESGEGEDKEDDEGVSDERDIWEVTL